jgi:hypothetical protein
MIRHPSKTFTPVDSTFSIPSANVKSSLYVDSVTKSFTPKSLLSYYDSTTYHQYDTTNYIPSVFSNHNLKPLHSNTLPVRNDNMNWLFFVLLFITIIYLYLQVNFYSRFTQVKRAFIVKRYYSQLIRDGNIFKERIIIPIYAIYILSFALLLFLILNFSVDIQKLTISKLNVYLVIVLLTIIYQGLKAALIRLLGKLFYTKNETETYLLNHLLFASLYCLILIPILWIFQYSQQPMFLVLALLFYVTLYFWRLVKAINNWSRVFTTFKLFLYLCTLEILPFVIGAKAILLGMKRFNV